MMKWYADLFQFREGSMKRTSLNRVKWFAILSLPAIPVGILVSYDIIPKVVATPILLISFISVLCFAFTPLANRFYGRDKYLDEWEIRLKHESMAFAFQTLLYIGFTLVLGAMLFGKYLDVDLSINSLYEATTGLFVFLLLGMYIQIFYALWKIRPIDEFEDEDLVGEY